MPTLNEKKLAAAMAAVMTYIRTEEEALAQQAMSYYPQPQYHTTEVVVEKITAVQMNSWGMTGRQAQMQMRTMMQMKAFHGVR